MKLLVPSVAILIFSICYANAEPIFGGGKKGGRGSSGSSYGAPSSSYGAPKPSYGGEGGKGKGGFDIGGLIKVTYRNDLFLKTN